MGGLLGDALLAAALLEADADGGGVREDVAADRLLGITEHGRRAGVRGDLPACAALEALESWRAEVSREAAAWRAEGCGGAPGW